MPDSRPGLLKALLSTALIILAHGCAEQNTRALKLGPQTPFIAAPIISPVPNTAIGQRLVALPDGRLSVAWWQNLPHAKSNLKISSLEGEKWTTAKTITDMPNIADAHIAAINEDSMSAMWMASKPYKAGGEVQDIYTSTANLSDNRWSKPLKVNQEKETSGKMLPAFTASQDGSLIAAWIDVPVSQPIPPDSPKATAENEPTTSLDIARISPDNTVVKRISAVKTFCGCCPPALTTDVQDALLVYRGLEPVNVRDPAIIHITQDKPSAPRTIHNDNWVFDGCPSSGPVIAVQQNTVAVAWTTMVNNMMIVRAAFSEENGRHFAAPIDVELENATTVSGIAMESAHSALVVWTGSGSKGEMIKLARVFADGRIEHRTTAHTLTSGGGYKWPGPRMVKTNDSVIVGWHDEQGMKVGLTKIKVNE